jgi:RHS repeat-associated protein
MFARRGLSLSRIRQANKIRLLSIASRQAWTRACHALVVLSLVIPNSMGVQSTKRIPQSDASPGIAEPLPIQSDYMPPTIERPVPRRILRNVATSPERFFGTRISLNQGFEPPSDKQSAGSTDGTYYYPVAAYLMRGTGGGFEFEDPENVADQGDENVLRGHYITPGASVWFLTLDFGGIITAPGGDWMFSKSGTLNDPTLDHNPWWAGGRVYYSIDGLTWPYYLWPDGDPPPSYPYFGHWPGNSTADGSTAWTSARQDGSRVPAGAMFRFLRLRLQEGRGIAPLEGWDGYNEVELMMDSFRVLPADFMSLVSFWSILSACNLEDCFSNFPQTQATVGEPINTHTGGYDYSVDDLAFSTASGPLLFRRTYASLAVDLLDKPLSPGWTHNHDVRLIFRDETSERPGVFFKAQSANQFEFFKTGENTFAPYPGVTATLTQTTGPPVTYTIVDQAQHTYTFDEYGALLTWEDSLGRVRTYTYDANERLEMVTDQTTGRYLEFEYDIQDRVETVSDHTGRQVIFAYDAAGDLISAVDVLGQTWTYTYDSEHRLTEVLDPRGVTVERTEYGMGSPITIDFNSVEITSYSGGQDQNPTMTIENDGATLHLVGNGWKKIPFPYSVTADTVLEFDFKSGSQAEVQGMGFDNDNNLSPGFTFQVYGTQDWGILNYKTYTDDAPKWAHFTIPVGEHYAGEMQYLFFANDHDVASPTGESYFSNVKVYQGQVRAQRQYNGEGDLVVELEFSPDGTTAIIDALGNTAVHTYDDRHTLIGKTDPEGNSVGKNYGNNLELDELTNETGATTSLEWGSDGVNLEQVIDAEGNQTDLSYDALNNLTGVTDPRGFPTDYTYTGTLLDSVLDPYNNETLYTYTTAADAPQPEGLLKTVQDPNGDITQYVYDAKGDRIKVIDALLNETNYTYDALGRRVTVEDPHGRVDWTCYDPAGRVVRTVANASGDGGTPATNPCNSDNYLPSALADVDRISTTVFDAVGDIIATIDDAGIITRTYYDLANRPTAVVQNLVGQAIEVGTPPVYDPAHPDRNVRSETVYDAAGNVIASIDTLGHITRTYYDALNRPQVIVRNLIGQAIDVSTPPTYDPAHPDRNVRSEYVYDEAGRTIASIDTLGRVTRTYYDALSRPEVVVQNLTGQAIDVETPPNYDPAHPDQNVRVDSVYDESGNAIASINTLGHITRTYFDALNRPIVTVQNLIGQAIEVETPPTYDPTYPDQNVRGETVYDAAGNAIASVDALGRITRTYYNDLNHPQVVVQNLIGQAIVVSTPPPFDPAYPDRNVRTEYVYDDAGRTTATIDTLGHITRTYYDDIGRSSVVVGNLVGQTITNPIPPSYDPAYPERNIRTEYVYDVSGRGIATIDTLQRIRRTYYDALGRAVVEVQNLHGQSITHPTPPAYDPAHPDRNVRSEFVFDGTGKLQKSTTANGLVSYSCYDGLNRAVRTVLNPTVGDPCGVYVPSAKSAFDVIDETVYDGLGNVLSTRDADGGRTTFAHDGLNRQVSVTDPLLNTTQHTYDGLGNRIGLTDAEGVLTEYEYDALNRLTAVVENAIDGASPDHETNVRTEYLYDATGARKRIRDGRGHDTLFAYDELNRLLSETDALGHVTSYAFDGLGNRTSLTDAMGAVTTFTYDDLNRLVGIDYPAPDADVAFVYEGLGNRLAMSDGVGTTTWAYDELNRPTAITDPFDDTVSYSYDAGGSRLSLTYPDLKQVLYRYDAADRLRKVTDWDANITRYTYQKSGRLRMVQLPNGVTSSYEYDAAGRLTFLEHKTEVEPRSSFAYRYDGVGNRIWVEEAVVQPKVTTPAPAQEGTATPTPTATATATYSASATPTATPSDTPTTTTSFTPTSTPTAIDTFTPTATGTPTPTAIHTSTPTGTPTQTPTATPTTLSSATSTPTPMPPTATVTHTATPGGGARSGKGYGLVPAELVFGEVGQITDLQHEPQTVYLSRDYHDPVVFAMPLSYDEADPAVVRVTDVQADRFTLFIDEAPDKEGSHAAETVSYLVLESGMWALANGTRLEVGKISTDATVGKFLKNRWAQVEFQGSFSQKPVVFSQVQTTHDAAFVSTRQRGISKSGFKLALEGAEAATGKHAEERLGWLAIEPGSGTWSGHTYEVGGTASAVTQLWYDIDFGAAFSSVPRFIASLTTYNEDDSAHLRYRGLRKDGVRVKAEEDTTLDQEIKHASEAVSYLVLQDDGLLSGRSLGIIMNELNLDLPGERELVVTRIDYTYDPLYRLTAADYESGEFFHYTYDAVGNRLEQETHVETNAYVYDDANRLIEVDDVPYTWDDKGNLLSDGVNAYAYNHANRLSSVVQGTDTYSFTYNGLGDRLGQAVNGDSTDYTLDLNSSLTQVLSDGTNAYLYGFNRIDEYGVDGWAYHHGDALGSLRQLTDGDALLTLTKSYEPYGSKLKSFWDGASQYGFTGEWTDGMGLVHLRTRYYTPESGRFLTRDSWDGDSKVPMSYNAWLYVYANPINHSDPSGQCLVIGTDGECYYPRNRRYFRLRTSQNINYRCHPLSPPNECIPMPCRNELVPPPERRDACPGPGCTYIGNFNLSAYYAPLETDWGGNKVRVPATEYFARTVGKYLGNEKSCVGTATGLCYMDDPDYALRASEKFLYRSDSICYQGMGKVEDGRYISCTVRVTWTGMPTIREGIKFEWKGKPGQYVAFKTAASNPNNQQLKDELIYIPELVTALEENGVSHPNLDGWLTVSDVGGGLSMNSIDIYIGEGDQALFRYYSIVRQIEDTPVYIRH